MLKRVHTRERSGRVRNATWRGTTSVSLRIATVSLTSQSYPVSVGVLVPNTVIARQNTLHVGQFNGLMYVLKAGGGWSLQNSATISRLLTSRWSDLALSTMTSSLQA